MNDDQKRVLRLALDHAAFSDHTEPSRDDQRLVLEMLDTQWPVDGFRRLARQIVFQAIAHEGAFANLAEK